MEGREDRRQGTGREELLAVQTNENIFFNRTWTPESRVPCSLGLIWLAKSTTDWFFEEKNIAVC
jgi:hypothetical protein